jgi:hypothetical protein
MVLYYVDLIGVPDFLGSPDSESQDLVDKAAALGGSLHLIQSLSYSAILNSPVIVGQSLMGSGNSDIRPGALKSSSATLGTPIVYQSRMVSGSTWFHMYHRIGNLISS